MNGNDALEQMKSLSLYDLFSEAMRSDEVREYFLGLLQKPGAESSYDDSRRSAGADYGYDDSRRSASDDYGYGDSRQTAGAEYGYGESRQSASDDYYSWRDGVQNSREQRPQAKTSWSLCGRRDDASNLRAELQECKRQLEECQSELKDCQSKLEEAQTNAAERLEALRQEKADAVQRLQREKADLQLENDDLQREKNGLLREKSEGESRLQQAQGDIQRLQRENSQAQAQVEKLNGETRRVRGELQQIELQMQGYKKHCASFIAAFECHERLSPRMQKELQGLTGGGNLAVLVSSCTNKNRLKQLWEYAKNKLAEQGGPRGESEASLNELTQLFRHAFAIFQSAESAYFLIEPQRGEMFNFEAHSVRGNKSSGQVARLLLPGVGRALGEEPGAPRQVELKAFVEL